MKNQNRKEKGIEMREMETILQKIENGEFELYELTILILCTKNLLLILKLDESQNPDKEGMKETPCLTEIQHKQLSLYLVHLKRVGTRHASYLQKVEWWIR